MKKKMISLFLCGMMAVTAIVGCGGSGETKSEESGSEVVEIEFWYGLGGKLGETMESIINDFNETQDEVKVIGVQQSDYAETKRLVQSAIASGKVPATVLFTNQYLQQFAEKGTLEYLDSYIENAPEFHKEDLVESLMDYCQDADGRIFGLPVYGTTQVMYYNIKAFKDAGINASDIKTWQDLSAAAKKIHEKNSKMAGWEPMWGKDNMVDAALSNGASILSKDGKTVEINSDAWVEVWDSFRSWIHDDKTMKIHSGGQGWEYWYKTIDDVLANKAGGYTGSSGDQADLDFTKVAAMEQPGWGSNASAPTANALQLVMLENSSDEEKQGVYEFMKYFTTAENQANWSMNTGYVAVRKSTQDVEKFKTYAKDHPQALVPLQQAMHGSILPEDPTGGKIWDALKIAADEVEIEGKSAKEALDKAQKTAQEALDAVQ